MSLDIDLCCPHCKSTLYACNITHNLNHMAEEAGIYGIVWRPEENGIETAGQLVKPLTLAIAEMCSEPERFKKLDAPNQWGTYENFLPWLIGLRDACNEHKTAKVEASR